MVKRLKSQSLSTQHVLFFSTPLTYSHAIFLYFPISSINMYQPHVTDVVQTRAIMRLWVLDVQLVLQPELWLVVTGTEMLPLPAGGWLIGQSGAGHRPSRQRRTPVPSYSLNLFREVWRGSQTNTAVLTSKTYRWHRIHQEALSVKPELSWAAFIMWSDSRISCDIGAKQRKKQRWPSICLQSWGRPDNS